jgi:hypothetical protein
MTASFVAYIDESGDEGFKFRTESDEQSSSDWFILAGFITRKRTDLETVKAIDRVRDEFKLHPSKHIHWKDLKHPRKVRYAQIIATLQARLIAVCVHKPSLLEPETFQQRYRLYFYAVRYLLERISWLARDSHNPAKWGGDGTVELLFSNRQGMSYEEMRDYLRLLKIRQDAGQDVRIEFDNVVIDKIKTRTPGKSMGLQLADATAGAFFNALEADSFGNTEPRYVQTMAPVVYRHEGILHGYGLKIVPREAVFALEGDDNTAWISEFT